MSRIPDCEHKEKPHYGKGLCAECYRKLPEVKSRRLDLSRRRREGGYYKTEEYKDKSKQRKTRYRQIGSGRIKDKEYKCSDKYKKYLVSPRVKSMKRVRHRLSKCKHKECLLFDNPSEVYDEIIAIYENCPKGLVVDHILPTDGNSSVCGLFVPWNLQYLNSADNCNKGNQFDGTYENESWRNLAIQCIETGDIFTNQKLAAKFAKTSQGNISSVLNGKYKQIKGYTFKYVNINDHQG